MSLSRTPSPVPGGGWRSEGLTSHSGNGSPGTPPYPNGSNVSWASAQARSSKVRGYPSFSTKNQGFFRRHLRRLSSSLPMFAHDGSSGISEAEREKIERGDTGAGGWWPMNSGSKSAQIARRILRLAWRMRTRLGIVLGLLFCIVMFYATPLHYVYRRISWLGGGSKFVIVLGANEGGGVMEWKGPREWAIERDSVRNKRRYAARWGYDLEIVDMTTKKRYAHEWRESWEKVDTMRNTMRKYPNAEWFWWLDLNTFIMEPSISLDQQVFRHLKENVYRDINAFNPTNISHPPSAHYLDKITLSPDGDGNPDSIDLLLTQDCSGFNLGSFFMRRSTSVERLMDIWWDPVGYEQKHMQWEHKEQDALESIYTNVPWVRSRVAFLPQRKINSFPAAACTTLEGVSDHPTEVTQDQLDPQYHYNPKDRDFLVNMAGCEFGRDCWGEIYNFRELSNYLNRTRWERFKDFISDSWNAMWGKS